MALPGIITSAILLRFFTAAPMLDDFPDIIAFASSFHKAVGPSAKLSLVLFTQASNYKLVFLQSLIALELITFGHLNFHILVLIGNLALIGIFLLLAKNTNLGTSFGARHWLRLLPVGLLLFGLSYAETVDWALCSLQQLAGILFAMASLHFLTRSAALYRSFVAACLFAMLAVSSNACGLLVFPVGVLFLLLRNSYAKHPDHTRTQSSALQTTALIAIWLGLLAGSTFFYFFRFNAQGVTNHISLVRKLEFMVMFCGNSIENMHHRPVPYLSMALGCFVLGTFAVAMRNRYDRTHPFFFFTALWLIATAATVANTRISIGLELSLSGRYKIYCVLLMVFCYEYFLDIRLARTTSGSSNNGTEAASVQRFLTPVIFVTTIFFCSSEAVGVKFLSTRQTRANTAWNQYMTSGGAASPMFLVSEHMGAFELSQEETARRALNEDVALGIFLPSKH